MSAKPSIPEATDVAVVGGGIMGTSAAYFLSTETDRDVVLLEKDNIAAGSTGDSSAILRHVYGPDEIYTKMAWWSHQVYRAFEDELGEPLAYEENPLVSFAGEGSTAADRNEASYDILASLEIPVSRLDREDWKSRYPMLSLDEDLDFAVSDDAAAYSDGTDAANGFARTAERNGATVVTGVSVTDVTTEDGTVTGVKTDQGPIECADVILAAGPWTTRLTDRLGVDVPLLIEREQIVILDPPAEYKEKYPDLVPTTGIPDGRFYLRPDFQDGVLVATHHDGQEVNPDAYPQTPDEEMLLDVTDEISDILPELGDAGVQGQYCGLYSTTPDNDFIIDQVGPDGCYLACGFSGHGFKHGPAVGKILSDLVTTGESELVDTEFFSLDRFEADPEGHGPPRDAI